MQLICRCSLLILLLLCVSRISIATTEDMSSPVGLWKTIDDKSGKAKSLVRIYEQDGMLFGRIEKILSPGKEENTCNKCKDERKDQPLLGLLIMRHAKFSGDEYRDGDIVDPENGEVYRCNFRLEDGGSKLEMHGFLGISLFGRSQTWERQPSVNSTSASSANH